MVFQPAGLDGAYIISLEKKCDERGFFARCFCEEEFRLAGLESHFVQNNISVNSRRGTLRGMHYQRAPKEEAKLVWCIKGAVYDVIVDLRPHSPQHRNWIGIQLDDESRHALYVPAGFAHGFQTLTDDAAVFYWMSEHYAPAYSAGVRWNDAAFNIAWPLKDIIASERDLAYPDYRP
jgi:dTDP-4-dehydrorhamnose 3,5-epimerase